MIDEAGDGQSLAEPASAGIKLSIKTRSLLY